MNRPEDYLQAMDVFVMTSLFEGLPIVGVEAQASGLPCIFADTITQEVKILPQTQFLALTQPDEHGQSVLSRQSRWNAALRDIA